MSRNGSGKKSRRVPSPIREEDQPYSRLGNLPRSAKSKPDYFEPLDGSTIRFKKIVKPRTPGQEAYFKSVRSKVAISLCLGPAGTGKTYLACAAALQAVQEGSIDKIYVTRPAVESGENVGFLPGDIDAKMMPYMMPIIDCFVDLVGGKTTDLLFKKGVVQVRPFAFMRGSTFSRSIIIADEMQNSTVDQFRCLLTRIGEGSKMIVSGDPKQSDLKEQNGLSDFISKYRKFYGETRTLPSHFSFDILREEDIVRHPAVKEVLGIYSYKQDNSENEELEDEQRQNP